MISNIDMIKSRITLYLKRAVISGHSLDLNNEKEEKKSKDKLRWTVHNSNYISLMPSIAAP